MKKDEKIYFNREIREILKAMNITNPQSDEYKELLARLSKVVETRNNARAINPKDVMFVAANILSIVMILKFERLNTITSKAIGFIFKPKI